MFKRRHGKRSHIILLSKNVISIASSTSYIHIIRAFGFVWECTAYWQLEIMIFCDQIVESCLCNNIHSKTLNIAVYRWLITNDNECHDLIISYRLDCVIVVDRHGNQGCHVLCQIERLKTPHHVIIQKMAKLYYTSCLDGVWIKIKKVWINPNKSMH